MNAPRRELAVSTATAEGLLAHLEQVPPAELAGSAEAVVGILRAIENLDEVIRTSEQMIVRASAMRIRLQAMHLRAMQARPEKWAPRPGGKVSNGVPNTTETAQDEPEGG